MTLNVNSDRKKNSCPGTLATSHPLFMHQFPTYIAKIVVMSAAWDYEGCQCNFGEDDMPTTGRGPRVRGATRSGGVGGTALAHFLQARLTSLSLYCFQVLGSSSQGPRGCCNHNPTDHCCMHLCMIPGSRQPRAAAELTCSENLLGACEGSCEEAE